MDKKAIYLSKVFKNEIQINKILPFKTFASPSSFPRNIGNKNIFRKNRKKKCLGTPQKALTAHEDLKLIF